MELVNSEGGAAEEPWSSSQYMHMKVATIVVDDNLWRFWQPAIQDVKESAGTFLTLHEGEAKRKTMRAEKAEEARCPAWVAVAVLVACGPLLSSRLTIGRPLGDEPP